MDSSKERDIDVETVFEMYDAQKQGFLQMKELENVLQVFNIKMTPEEIHGILRDGQESISLDDLKAIVSKGGETLLPEEELRASFQHFDSTDTGFITRHHLEFILTGYGLQLSASESDKLIKLVMEKEEALNYNKFIKLLSDLGLLKKPEPIQEVQLSKPKAKKKSGKSPKREKGKAPSTPKSQGNTTSKEKAPKSPSSTPREKAKSGSAKKTEKTTKSATPKRKAG